MNPGAYLEMAETESKHWWFSARRAILSKTIESLKLDTQDILEVGCGTGGNLEMLSKYGNIKAFEMDGVARDIALKKTNHRFDIREGWCPENIPFTEKFDLICMFDVLEHIEKDTEALESLKKMLKKGGVILMTVPAYQWLYGTHDLNLHHKRRYTSGSLKKRLLLVGLQPIKLSYFNTILFPLAVFVRFMDQLFKKTSQSGTSTPPFILNYIFEKIFRLEKLLLKYMNLPFGVSIIAVLSNPED